MKLALEVAHVCACYGALRVLHEVSMEVGSGEIVTIIGSNGAGKSTLLKTIAGWLKPVSGKISLDGESIAGLPPHRLVRLGIAVCPEGRRVFPQLTVLENLQMGAYSRPGKEWLADLERVFRLFPRLAERKRQLGSSLSGGEQQMLAIARALMGSPELLLLDEPTEGLAPIIVKALEEQILKLKQAGISILLAEQNIKSALKLIDRVYVIDNGSIKFEGTKKDLEQNEEITRRYLLV